MCNVLVILITCKF